MLVHFQQLESAEDQHLSRILYQRHLHQQQLDDEQRVSQGQLQVKRPHTPSSRESPKPTHKEPPKSSAGQYMPNLDD